MLALGLGSLKGSMTVTAIELACWVGEAEGK